MCLIKGSGGPVVSAAVITKTIWVSENGAHTQRRGTLGQTSAGDKYLTGTHSMHSFLSQTLLATS